MGTAQAHRFLDRHGQDVVVTTFSDSGATNDRGGIIWDETQTTVKARVDVMTEERPIITVMGESATVDASIYVKNTVTVHAPTETQKRSILRAGGTDYAVVAIDPQGNGLQRLLCQRMR